MSYEVLLPGAPGVVKAASLQQPQFGPALDLAVLAPYLYVGFGPGPLCGFEPYHFVMARCLTSHAVLVGLVPLPGSWQNYCELAEVAAVQEAVPVGCMAWQIGSRSAGEGRTGHPVLPSFPGQPGVEPLN